MALIFLLVEESAQEPSLSSVLRCPANQIVETFTNVFVWLAQSEFLFTVLGEDV